MQRERILGAVTEVVAERGVVGASVELVIARARVSSRTFYQQFGGLEECVVAVLFGALERVGQLVVGAFGDGLAWQDGMRAALAGVLDFFDGEPQLARICLVEALRGGPLILQQRERIVEIFRALVVERIEPEVSHVSPLAMEGGLALVMGVVRARVIAQERAPLVGLVGPLMGIIVGPFMEEAQVAREIEKGDQLAREMLQRRGLLGQTGGVPGAAYGPVEIPDVLLRPGAFRVRQCLLYVAERGERGHHPSNREVGEGIGVSHRGQAGALLAQLSRLGLLVKRPGPPGHPNAWRLTTEGELVVKALGHDRYGVRSE